MISMSQTKEQKVMSELTQKLSEINLSWSRGSGSIEELPDIVVDDLGMVFVTWENAVLIYDKALYDVDEKNMNSTDKRFLAKFTLTEFNQLIRNIGDSVKQFKTYIALHKL